MKSNVVIENLWRSKQCETLLSEMASGSDRAAAEGRGPLLAAASELWLGRPQRAVPWLTKASQSEMLRPQALHLLELARPACVHESDEHVPQDAGVTSAVIGRLTKAINAQPNADQRLARAVVELVVDPEDPSHWINVGHQIRDFDYRSALEILEHALRLDAQNAQLMVDVANLIRRVRPGQLLDAIALLRQAAVMIPGDAFVHLYLGNLLWELGDLEAAEAAMKAASNAETDVVDGKGFYGDFLVSIGRCDEGLPLLEEAMHMEPEGWTFYYGRGLYVCRQYRAAESWLSKAVALDPEYEPSRVFLSMARAKLSDSSS